MNTRKILLDLILPENPILICDSPNQQQREKKVKGKLRVTTIKPIEISQIEICYKVKTHLDWKDESTQNGILFSKKRMTASKTLRKKKQCLLKQHMIIPVGTTDIGFDVFIPSHMYPSLQSKYCQIKHLVSAKLILPMKMLNNEIVIKKSILVKKTSVPKEISMCMVPIPRLLMTGERLNLIDWTFQVPIWVCLQTNVEFEGIFHANTTSVTLTKIQIDVLQEELYYYDVSCTDVKRRLVTNINLPSIYVEPPLNSNISFSFPLFNNRKDVILSLDSPFSRIRHFIRVIVSINNCTSICIGLPIQVTPHVSLECENVIQNDSLDLLPTYQSVIKQGDRLPKYTTGTQEHREKGNTIFPCSSTAEIMPVGERSMEEFCAITL